MAGQPPAWTHPPPGRHAWTPARSRWSWPVKGQYQGMVDPMSSIITAFDLSCLLPLTNTKQRENLLGPSVFVDLEVPGY